MFELKKIYLCSILITLEVISHVLSFPTFGGSENHFAGGGLGSYGVHEASGHPLISNDHHGGVSIIGAGGSAHKGITLDLTNQGGPAHTGLFGGSFLSSGNHGKSSGYHTGDIQEAHSGSYSAALSSYDVGGHGLSAGGHDGGEISPVLYSSYKENEHNYGLHSAGLHSGGFQAAFDSHSITSPQQFTGGNSFDHSSGFGH